MILVVAITTTNNRLYAQQTVVVDFQFQFVRQGSVGIIKISGPDVMSGIAHALNHDYRFFSATDGYAALLSVPMDTPIKDYPLRIDIARADGSSVNWTGTLKVATGQFIQEPSVLLPSNKVYLLSQQIQEDEDAKLLSTYRMVTPDRYWDGRFTTPVNAALSSPFGSWRLFNAGIERRHTGQDFRVPIGTPVLASANGRVVLSRPLDIHGESIVIDHGWGIFTEYSHLSARYVVPGQFVLQGDIIGLSGNTGRITGPCVHWEVAVDGTWVDPLGFLTVKLP